MAVHDAALAGLRPEDPKAAPMRPPLTPRPSSQNSTSQASSPTQAAFAAQVQALGDGRIERAYDAFVSAKKQVAITQQAPQTPPEWPMAPSLLNPGLQASYARHHSQQDAKKESHKGAVDVLWQRYQREMSVANVQQHIVEVDRTPPRIIQLVGGIDVFAALPELDWADRAAQVIEPQSLSPAQLPGPITRGRAADGRQFLSVAFHSEGLRGAVCSGVVTLLQSYAHPDAGWVTLNPNRFLPPTMALRGLITPTYPNMGGRGALAGGADAQLMLQALTTLCQTGSLGHYRLGVGPGPSAPGGL
jgi:hypothetical protein